MIVPTPSWNLLLLVLTIRHSALGAPTGDDSNESNDEVSIKPDRNGNGQYFVQEGVQMMLTCSSTKAHDVEWTLPPRHIQHQGEHRFKFGKHGRHQVTKTRRKGVQAILTFKNVSMDDSGIYTCTATFDDASTPKEERVDLQVISALRWTSPTRYEVTEGVATTIECNADGNPAPDIIFSPPNGGEFLESDYTVHANSLIIKHPSVDTTFSEITCTAVQEIEDQKMSIVKSQTISIDVQYSPKIEDAEDADLKHPVYGIDELNATIRCRVEKANPPAYQFQFWKGSDTEVVNDWKNEIKVDRMKQIAELHIKDLTDDDFDQDYSCSITNKIGRSEKRFRLLKTRQPGQAIARAERIDSNSVTLHIEDPDDTGGEGILIKEYKVEYWRNLAADGDENTEKSVEPTNPLQRTFIKGSGPYRIEKLAPSASYQMRVRAGNGAGFGEHVEFNIKTLQAGASRDNSAERPQFAGLALFAILTLLLAQFDE